MKKEIKRLIILSLLSIILIFSICKTTFSIQTMEINYDTDEKIETEYSEEYKEWLKLTEEEQEGCYAPSMYDDEQITTIDTTNPLKLAKIEQLSLESRFTLKDIIPENLTHKNQGSTSACWVFTAIRVLETNLALSDYYNNKQTKVYDFSERHMEYATSSVFKDGTNYNGYYRKVGSGGYDNMSYGYFTNGTGAVPESEMPFENNKNLIYLSALKNKTVSTRVYDIARYSYSSVNDEGMIAIKNHIKNYGGLATSNYFNSSAVNWSTCAAYNASGSLNHAVTIVGWDDNYSRTNFLSSNRPSKNGAWIAINSSGSSCPYLYISYYDSVVNDPLYGISKATTDVNYNNIYQHDYYGPTSKWYVENTQLYLGNVFTRKTNEIEYLTDVAIHTAETYTVKVYVNPNGTSMDKENLQQVKLKAGDYETIGHGYHTLEFLNPIKLSGDSFAVVLEIKTTGDNVTWFYTEKNTSDYSYDNYVTDSGKSYYSTKDVFADSSNWKSQGSDNVIKAFTVAGVKNLTIKTKPNKTAYIEGENFNKTGMVVVANYNNGKSETIEDYTIIGGTNLKSGQTSVTITHRNGSVKVPITVEKNSVISIKVKTPPTKTEYKTGENFNTSGMVVEATYKDGKTKQISNYEVIDGKNLKSNQTYVTISYEGKTVKQVITMSKTKIEKIVITTPPKKTKYAPGEDFDETGMVVSAVYNDGKKVNITNYSITNGKNLTLGQSTVTITYENKKVTQKITVENKTVTGISIKQMPTKTQYEKDVGELNLTGGILNVEYSDGSQSEVLMSSKAITVTGFSNKNIGKITLTLSYKEKKTTMELQIIEVTGPKNSNFANLKSIVGEIKSYNYTDENKQSYVLMNIELEGIERFLSNDSFTYYYYLSSNSSENVIEDWIKITEQQSSSATLNFTINTNSIKNYNEISNSDTLYLYIKEVVTKSGNEQIAFSKSTLVKSNAEIETYLDDILQEVKEPVESNKTIIYIIMGVITLALIITGGVIFLKKRKNKYIDEDF